MAAWRSNPHAVQHTPNGPSVKMAPIEHPKQERPPKARQLRGKHLFRKARRVRKLAKTSHFAYVAGEALPNRQFTYKDKTGKRFNRFHAHEFAAAALRKALNWFKGR